jgi:hypothetical protein
MQYITSLVAKPSCPARSWGALWRLFAEPKAVGCVLQVLPLKLSPWRAA